MYAVKENKRYNIGDNESLRTSYLKKGFDIADESGKVVELSPAKSVPYVKYAEILKERDALKAQLAALPAAQEEAVEASEEESTGKKAGKK